MFNEQSGKQINNIILIWAFRYKTKESDLHESKLAKEKEQCSQVRSRNKARF